MPNIKTVASAVERAVSERADLVALPEASGLMNRDRDHAKQIVTDEHLDPYIDAVCKLAKASRIWIHIGSTPVRNSTGKFLNRSILVDGLGRICARYDKIHLFDVFLQGSRPTGESRRYDPGEEAVLVDTPWGPWGLTICYDLRFPEIYRDYAQNGATVLFAPSAFTVPTGNAHWETLLRCRAIENGAWVVAAAQVGTHEDGRVTYGHSMIVDPWGRVVVDLGGADVGQVTRDLDLELPMDVRAQVPSLTSGRAYRFRRVDARDSASSNQFNQKEEEHA